MSSQLSVLVKNKIYRTSIQRYLILFIILLYYSNLNPLATIWLTFLSGTLITALTCLEFDPLTKKGCKKIIYYHYSIKLFISLSIYFPVKEKL